MKILKSRFCLFIALTALLVFLTGCAGNGNTAGVSPAPDDGGGEVTSTPAAADAEGEAFSYSGIIDENGFWKGITALDYVELFDYDSLAIPRAAHTVSDEAVQSEIDALLEVYSTSEQITDRVVADGDTVNIDYVGSVDGIPFENGSTGGAGTEVTIGVTSYIDDFLEQLIGHAPGETFDVNVTFPEAYGVENLNGKDAVFVTTVNYVVLTLFPELTDDFVAENLSAEYGWKTVDELRDGIYTDLQKNAIRSYIQEYLYNGVTVKPAPEALLEYQENAMIQYYQSGADYYGMELEEFLTAYVGASLEQLIENQAEYNASTAKCSLAVQAVAEELNITVSDEDVAAYFRDWMDTDDYSEYEVSYGMPYLKQAVLTQIILDYISEHAVLE
ncbi:MAG: FKBP-type peptidyl-prolyl cis-trans isomerase [Oscillospiraceae bacterium]|jgi:trigger factor|nr:FKBP-type peptidyl-prolyl cis-trans isomerase [Oscillospiraceae bacterium]